MNSKQRIINEYEKVYLAANGTPAKVTYAGRRFIVNDGEKFTSAQIIFAIYNLKERVNNPSVTTKLIN